MKTIELIKTLERLNKPFYSISDIEKITGLSRKSLYVTLKRLVDRGILDRIGTGIYRTFTAKPSTEIIAASLYLPNYLSFESALSRHGVLNLIPYIFGIKLLSNLISVQISLILKTIFITHTDIFWGYA